MKRFLIVILTLVILLTSTFISPAFADADVDIPEAPDIEWDDDYSSSSSGQKVVMTARVPDGAKKMKFYLFANDKKLTAEERITSSTGRYVSEDFRYLDEEQEVWGYVVAYDEDDDASEPSEWVTEYIGKASNVEKDIDTPYEPEIEWDTRGESKRDNQKVTVTAEMPDDADYLQFFLICDGTVKSSGRIDDESYTFHSVDYEQTVIAYVKAYSHRTSDSSRYGSYRSPTVSLYIGDDGEVPIPDRPYIYWVDQGYNTSYGHRIVMSASIPSGAEQIRYYLEANGTIYQSEMTNSTTHTFFNIRDNQLVRGYIKVYDKWGNESELSAYSMLQIPNRTQTSPDSTEQNSSNNQQKPEQSQALKERIINKSKRISVKEFRLPPLWINASFHFTDVSEDDKELQEALQYFYSTRLLENTFNNEFYPERYMTRIDFLTLLLKAADLSKSEIPNVRSHFKDIDEKYKYRDEIIFANYKGIMRGYSDGHFYPDNKLTYTTAAKAVVNAFEIRSYSSSKESLIDDIGEHYLNVLAKANIIPQKSFDAFAYMTRGEAVKMIYRVIKLKLNSR